MSISLKAVGVVVVALSIGCTQPISPTSSTSVPPGDPSVISSPRSSTSVGIPATVAGQGVPFKGSLEGVVTITPQTPPFAFVLIEGTGNATQLGRFTLAVPHVVNFATAVGSGSYQFTAANGDELTAEFTDGRADTSTSVFSIEETATITGGTGRFAGATGVFTARRLFDTGTGLTTGSFEGTISSPGAGAP